MSERYVVCSMGYLNDQGATYVLVDLQERAVLFPTLRPGLFWSKDDAANLAVQLNGIHDGSLRLPDGDDAGTRSPPQHTVEGPPVGNVAPVGAYPGFASKGYRQREQRTTDRHKA